jgi:hypothetical protein
MEGRTLVALIICLPLFIIAQKPEFPEVDSGYFQSPINHSIRLSGNFCELRNNHFHAGIDLKSSNGQPGDDIMSVAEGFISRIKVSRSGYGNTVYIDHDCGLTSVYAHLHSFTDEIAQFVEKRQMSAETFEIDVKLDSSLFKIHQGELIGQMGNSGFSYGPHLHFELRHTASEVPINPMFYDFPLTDIRPPQIQDLTINWLDHRSNTIGSQNVSLRKEENVWVSSEDTIEVPAWRVGLTLATYDRQDGSSNKNGVYQIRCELDGTKTYQFTASHCSFEETNQINAHVDYEKRYRTGQWSHLCYRLPNNTLSMYDTMTNDGILSLFVHKVQRLVITVEDFHGNETSVSFYLKRKEGDYSQNPVNYHALFEYDRSNFYTSGGLSLVSQFDGLYQDLPLVIAPSLDEKKHLREVRIGHPTYPIKKHLKLSLEKSLYNQKLADKAVLIFQESRKGKHKSVGSSISDNGLEVSIPYLGLYGLGYDTIAPTITPISWKQEVTEGEMLVWKIKDNFEVTGNARGLRFDCRLNDEYILGIYDLKSDRLEIQVKNSWPKGRHLLSIIVTDDKENTNKWSRQIIIN